MIHLKNISFLFLFGMCALTSVLASGQAAPYVAEVKVTETQTLSDGTEMTNVSVRLEARSSSGILFTRTSAVTAKDGAGKYTLYKPAKLLYTTWTVPGDKVTEMAEFDPTNKTMKSCGMFPAAQQGPPQIAAIGNPYGGQKQASGSVVTANAQDNSNTGTGGSTTQAAPPVHPMVEEVPFGQLHGTPEHPVLKSPHMSKESLGLKPIQGIICEGTHITLTTEDGTIVTSSETWRPTDGQYKDIIFKQSSMNKGKFTTHELTSFKPVEPDAQLFQIPAGREVEHKSAPCAKMITNHAVVPSGSEAK